MPRFSFPYVRATLIRHFQNVARPLTINEIAEAIAVSRPAVHKTLSEMALAGEVSRALRERAPVEGPCVHCQGTGRMLRLSRANAGPAPFEYRLAAVPRAPTASPDPEE